MIDAVRQLGLLKTVETVPGFTRQALTDPEIYAEQRAAALARADLSFIHLQFEPISNKENKIGIFDLTHGGVTFRVEEMQDDPGRYLFLKTPSSSPNHSPTWKLSKPRELSGDINSKKLTDTVTQFEKLYKADPSPWIADLLRIFNAEEVVLPDPNPDGTLKTAGFYEAVRWAAKHRNISVFSVTIDGQYPGDIKDLALDRYEQKADTVYQTASATMYAGPDAICSLCRRQAPIYPNALSGAGFKITNSDKPGFFPGCNPDNAWQSAPICRDCADLIYTARWYVFPGLSQRVCGSGLLAIPHLLESESPDEMLRELVDSFTPQQSAPDVGDETEKILYETLSQSRSIASVTFLVGAVFGQDVTDISCMIPNVIPSRLAAVSREIRAINHEFKQYPDAHPFAFFGVGGGKARHRSNPLTPAFTIFETGFGIRKTGTTGSKYYVRHLDYDHLIPAILTNQPYPMRPLYADFAGKFQHDLRRGLTTPDKAPWAIRDVTRAAYVSFAFLHRLKIINLPSGVNYVKQYLLTERTKESLKPLNDFITNATGLDTPEKSYVFLLGMLTGKLVKIQGGRDVNPEPLRWIATSSFSDRDLHALFVRVRNKLDQYSMSKKGTGWSVEMQSVASAIAALGASINPWALSREEAAYWLALGQTLQPVYLPSKTRSDNPEDTKTTPMEGEP